MEFNLKDYLTVTFTLFAVIDIIGTIPVLISLKTKLGAIKEVTVTLISGVLMVFFLYIGQPFLNLLGLDVGSCALKAKIFTAMASNITPKNFRMAINPAGPRALSIIRNDFNTMKIKTRLVRIAKSITDCA